MDVASVNAFLVANASKFQVNKIPYIRERLLALDEERFSYVMTASIKDPTISLILSIFLGYLGVDRFFIGDIGLGVLKLLTVGCCGVFTIIDWFLIMDRTKDKNFENLMLFM